MKKIKSRMKVKNIKILNKSANFSARMKKACTMLTIYQKYMRL